MLEPRDASIRRNGWPGYAIMVVRLVIGYVVAVAAGALMFSAVMFVIGPGTAPGADPVPIGEAARRILDGSAMFFLLGLVFGIPYTIVGSILFRFVLPRHWLVFMLIGIACPMVAIVTMGLTLGGTAFLGPDFMKMLVMTLPSGVVATWLFGAIGFGFGFRRWRSA